MNVLLTKHTVRHTIQCVAFVIHREKCVVVGGTSVIYSFELSIVFISASYIETRTIYIYVGTVLTVF